jgi:hypothetical protein
MILLYLFLSFLSGCETLQPGDEHIKLVSGRLPQSCQFRGDVDSGVAKAPLVSHKKIEAMQTLTLKNQALKLHANVVLVTQHETVYYLPYVPPLYPLVIALKSHRMAGKAYDCDFAAMQWLQQHPSSVTDVRPGEL